MTRATLTVAVPAYNRTDELRELLDSFEEAEALPDELLIVEDDSPERAAIRALVESRVSGLAARDCSLRLVENAKNLGYDGNVRQAIALASSEWVMLLGNDDVIAPGGVAAVHGFIAEHPTVAMVSRTFFRFTNDRRKPMGISRAHVGNAVFTHSNARPAVAFRVCGFVGGLVVNREWAGTLSTDRYDGTLYYQMYLAFEAYCSRGIGYVDDVVVGGRAGGVPLFGSASAERSTHLPGSYRPKARAHMWASVLRIAEDVGRQRRVRLVDSVRHELDARQSFHVYEMMAGSSRSVLAELKHELRAIGLQRSLLARTLYWVDYLLGRHARRVYVAMRRIMQ